MKLAKILLLFILLTLPSENLFSQGWVQQYYGQSLPYYSIFFIDSNTGWIVTGRGVGQNYQGEILKSTNGGNNWFVVYSDNIGFSDVRFVNTLTGWATGLRRENFVYTRPILKTTDGGTTFFLQHSDTTSYSPLKIDFVNSFTGFVFTSSNNILKTTNSGLTWQSFTTGSPFSIADGLFTSPDTGWIASSVSTVLKTTNGGLNWFSVLGAGKIFWTSISFVNNLTGWVTDGGSLRYTSNGGSTWNFGQGGSNRIIKFINGSTGWSCGWYQSAYISKTTNGGVNWALQTPIYYNNFIYTDLFFVNQNTGWAVGYHYITPNYYSMILKTTNGGVTYVSPVSNEIPNDFSLSQNYPNPFNPNTIIRFKIKDSRLTTLKVFDILGREVATLVNEQLNPGTYEVDWDGSGFASGVYYYKLSAGDYTETKKMILVK